MIEVPLSKGKVALIDDEDAWITQWKWYYHHTGRAQRNVRVNRKRTMILMHRVILDAPDGVEVDHINHDTLDNRRSNLRLCTRSQNMMNVYKKMGTSSKYKGVHWHSREKKWVAKIRLNYNTKHLGSFDSELDAARAYDKAAREYFGEYALLNERELA